MARRLLSGYAECIFRVGKCEEDNPLAEENTMLPIKNILHPTDFSERSESAFRLACSLARDYDAQVLVLHAVPPPVIVYGNGVVPLEPAGYEERIKEKLQKMQDSVSTAQVKYKMVDGDPVTEILRTAKEAKSDLVVMGTHGWTGLSRLLMGSVAEGVVRRAPCPVLTVKTPFAEGKEPAVKTGQQLQTTKA